MLRACAVHVGRLPKKASEPAHQDETLEVSDSVQTAKAETEPFYVMVVGNDSRTGTVEITNRNTPTAPGAATC